MDCIGRRPRSKSSSLDLRSLANRSSTPRSRCSSRLNRLHDFHSQPNEAGQAQGGDAEYMRSDHLREIGTDYAEPKAPGGVNLAGKYVLFGKKWVATGRSGPIFGPPIPSKPGFLWKPPDASRVDVPRTRNARTFDPVRAPFLKSDGNRSLENEWCPGEDSNLHGVTHWYLKPARLPIPPPGPRRASTGREAALSTGSSGERGRSRRAVRRQSPRATALTRSTTVDTASSESPAQSGSRTSRALRSSVLGKAPCCRA